MKKIIYTFIICCMIAATSLAQAPQGLNYQAIARNSSGAILPAQNIGLRLTITNGNGGSTLYQETQATTTNLFGLFTINVGSGSVVSGTLAGISWGTVTPWLEVDMDPTGGTSYVTLGSSQLLSVPYALYAASGAGVTKLIAGAGVALTDSVGNIKITNTADSTWNINGNSGTNPSTNFIGTIDNQSLVFKVNNIQAGLIQYANYYANTAIGSETLYRSYTPLMDGNGTLNTAMGVSALYNDTSGGENTAIGANALFNNTSGNFNTAVGEGALFGGSGNTTGIYNTGIGWGTLSHNSTGNYNTALGAFADQDNCCPNLSNITVLGYNAGVTSSNTVAIGNTSVTAIQGQVNFTTFSDKRVKNTVQHNVPGLSFITSLEPVTYHYDISKEQELLGKKDKNDWEGKHDIENIAFSGFLAQDVDSVAKNIGYDFSGVDKSGSLWGLRYSEFVVPLVKAVQEQQQQIEELKNEVKELEQQVSQKIKVKMVENR